MRNIILTGGGTGGHIYPNIAMLPLLKGKFNNIYYFGGKGIEKDIARKNNLDFFETETVKFDRKHLLKNLAIPHLLKEAVKKTKMTLKLLSPSIILSKGGYASLPTALAGLEMGIPVICHESDLTLGLANKLAIKKGAYLAAANEETARKYNGSFVGIPLRKELFEISPIEARYTLEYHKRIVLILGGSSGANAINEIAKLLPPLLGEGYIILHACGKNKTDNFKAKNYIQFEYIDNIPLYLNAADIVVSRCGATALHEIAALKKKAIFIPLPKGISRGDQELNATIAANHGGLIINQKDLTASLLANSITSLKTHMEQLAYKPNEKLFELIEEKAKK